MSRTYRDVEKEVVTRRECVEAHCDMCRRKAEYSGALGRGGSGFEYGGMGTGSGLVLAQYWIDGEDDVQGLDLCYECAEWLISQIKSGEIKRKQKNITQMSED